MFTHCSFDSQTAEYDRWTSWATRVKGGKLFVPRPQGVPMESHKNHIYNYISNWDLEPKYSQYLYSMSKYQKCSLGREIHWYWFTEPHDLHMYRDASTGAEKDETDKGFIPSGFFFFYVRSESCTQKPNVTANVASQEIASVSEGVSTAFENEDVDDRENVLCVLMHLREKTREREYFLLGGLFVYWYERCGSNNFQIPKYPALLPLNMYCRWVTCQLKVSGRVMWNKDLGADKGNV